ncbi:MAG: sulfide/dihydroorotate dehydrogenase-like FAD/NAD-binding protein [Kiritimatiellae bacterium]|jgi:ferredoxin--NADP+ reductase|nr:sulfide/dihydroorotate dehydrogenase-like FAD/NAD-binding protein [Kiritimatiellia bacterium]MDY0149479.1 sulfide/dihydroorotate dehydrogenase-like FAD/NAD-binding protein [Kiritimatiellia bacterium]
MNQILFKEQLSPDVYRLRVRAPLIAEERQPGQFVILQLDTEYGERIPLTIADADTEEGSITLIVQAVGKSTILLGQMPVGGRIANLVGPLGRPTHIEKVGRVVCVGGGIGVAPLYPIAQGMKKAGNHLTVVIGARTKDLMILEQEMRALADEVLICTDDGTYGHHGLVTAPLKELCAGAPKPDLVVAIGPPLMMKFCAETTKPYGVPTVVSLNSIMIDGTGMCGGCRVTVGGKTKFVCVDGPEFDGHQVDFDQLIQRLGSYRKQETIAADGCHLHTEAKKKGLVE